MPNRSPRPARALLVFLDGVGIGPGDPEVNPFAAADLPRLRALLGGRRPVSEALDAGGLIRGPGAELVAVDATLGVEGTPQSGTGQTALLTGVNAAAEYGRHFGPWVPTGLRPLLAERNLLVRAAAAGRSVGFANAYPTSGALADPRIFRRPAAPPLAALAAGVLSRGFDELVAGSALASSITNERWRERVGDLVPEVGAEEAARRLARIAAGSGVTLFAHYDTDYVGHRGGLEGGVAALEKVDAFLGELAGVIPPDLLLVVSSDHGNLEDVRAGHTRHPVPLLAVGPGSRELAERVRSIDQITPTLLALLGIEP